VRAAFPCAVTAFALAFPLGAGAARALLVRAPARLGTDLAQPLPVVTAWGVYGVSCFATLAAAVALATCALVAIVATAPSSLVDRPERTRAFALAGAAIALAGAALFPFTFSSDPYAYAAYGEMAARGLDPYTLAPALVHGPAIDAARYQWSGSYPVCVYGPAFVAFSAGIGDLTRAFGVAATIAAFRSTAAAAFLGSVALLDAALAGLATRRRFALVCAYALDPVALWSVAEGHNDAFVLLAATAALALARRGTWFVAGALLGLSAIVKAPGAFLAVGFGLGAAVLRRRMRGAAGAAIGLAVAAAVAIPPSLPAISGAATHGTYAPSVSLQSLVGLGPALALAAATTLYALVRIARGDRRGFAWLGLGAVAALPNLYPWYALWLVPWALVAGRTGASAALYGVTICALVRYLPDAAGNMTTETVRFITIGALAPLVAAPAALAVLRHQKAVAES
jgi:alpha-1,6-mannosyltransferase